jgi:hypothetical protein
MESCTWTKEIVELHTFSHWTADVEMRMLKVLKHVFATNQTGMLKKFLKKN